MILSEEEEGFGSNVLCSHCFDEKENPERHNELIADKNIQNDEEIESDYYFSDEKFDDDSTKNAKKRRSFPIRLKNEIIDYAAKNTIMGASKKYKVDRKNIRNWIESKRELEISE